MLTSYWLKCMHRRYLYAQLLYVDKESAREILTELVTMEYEHQACCSEGMDRVCYYGSYSGGIVVAEKG
jgi:hypothetical protein